MLNEADKYFLQKEEPFKGCLIFLRQHILNQDKKVIEVWQYGMPFYCYNGKRFCYLWVHKKYNQPYIGIVDGKQVHHRDLLVEKRARMKILLIDAGKDIPVKKIDEILKKALALCQ